MADNGLPQIRDIKDAPPDNASETDSPPPSGTPTPPAPPGGIATNFAERTSHFTKTNGCFSTILGFLLFAVIVGGALFYILQQRSIFPTGNIPMSLSVPPNPLSQTSLSSYSTIQQDSAYVILGEFNNKIFTFNKGVKKIYAYNLSDQKDYEYCDSIDFDKFWWHNSGEIIFLSHAYDLHGSLYLLDLAGASTPSTSQTTPSPVKPKIELLTSRTEDVFFPSNLELNASLPISLSETGDTVAFVAEDIQTKTESLFVFELTSRKLFYTSARNLDKISSILWINSDSQLALVGISNGIEKRYFVDRSGGKFITWPIK